MTKALDLTNRRIGRLLVLDRCENIGSKSRARSQWLCRCDCGKLTRILGTSLTKRQPTESCGCLHTESISRRLSLRPYESAYRRIGNDGRKFLVDLTYEEYLNLTTQNRCHYCHSRVIWQIHNATHHNLDRKDSACGYSKANCVVCCPRCNRGKGDWFSYDEWWAMTEIFRRKI